MPKSGYCNGASRQRFDRKFEVQKRPWVFRCELDHDNWGLPADTPAETVDSLNKAIINCVNSGNDRESIEGKLAFIVPGLSLTDDVRDGVLRVIDRLLRAVFD